MARPINLSDASTLEQQGYLIALELQKKELALAEDARPDNTQIAFDTEANTVAITYALNTNIRVENGEAVISVLPYLND